MRTWYSADIYRPFRRNVLFYDGPSLLTGDRILVIATAQNGNRKIGHMVQIWIIPAESPLNAVRDGRDRAVCGDCQNRGVGLKERVCYVYLPGVDNIWQAREKAERLSPEAFAEKVAGLQLRIGAYGDPVAVPHRVWAPLIASAGGWTAYTHQYRRADDRFKRWCMASVESLEEQAAAAAAGWRTFRVRGAAEVPAPFEVVCPASEEAGHRTVCANCELCRGASRHAKHVVIQVHGIGVKWFGSKRPQSAPAEALR